MRKRESNVSRKAVKWGSRSALHWFGPSQEGVVAGGGRPQVRRTSAVAVADSRWAASCQWPVTRSLLNPPRMNGLRHCVVTTTIKVPFISAWRRSGAGVELFQGVARGSYQARTPESASMRRRGGCALPCAPSITMCTCRCRPCV